MAGQKGRKEERLAKEPAAAEICRAQLWRLRFEAPFDDGRRFSLDLFEDWLADELAALGDLPILKPAARLLHELVTADDFEEFLTLPAYELLN